MRATNDVIRKCQTCGKPAHYGSPECNDCQSVRFEQGFIAERAAKLAYLKSKQVHCQSA